MKDQIKLHLIMGFTRSPDDGACFVNLRDPKRGVLCQSQLTEAEWNDLKDAKEGYQPPLRKPK